MVKAKKRNQDFKKVKLKVGKKLAKPNETATDFKARKIVLLGQLQCQAKPDAFGLNQLVSHRHLNTKELCHRMRHHNANVRKDSVLELKQLITRQNSEQLRLSLKLILESSFPLITDLDQEVRNAFMSLFKEILTKTKSIDFSPNFSLVVAHLVCAMTHLNSAVKFFAIKLVQLLIDNLPDLIRGNVELLKSYADLLSNFKEKNLTRAFKSTILSGLHSLLSLNYGEAAKSRGVNQTRAVYAADEKRVLNPTRCSLTAARIGGPFDFPIYADHCSNLASGQIDEIPVNVDTYVEVAEKSLKFCRAFWLEIATSDDKSLDSIDRSFDTDLITDMERILSVVDTLFQLHARIRRDSSLMTHHSSSMTHRVSPMTHHSLILTHRSLGDESSSTSLTRRLDALSNEYFTNDKMLEHYAAVFPCRYRRSVGDDRSHVTNSCLRINLIICQFSLHKLDKRRVIAYLGKLGESERLPKDLKSRMDQIYAILR